jgi:hypothetical protein
MVEKRGKYIRAWAYDYEGRIVLEIADITDVGYENSILLITTREEFEKEARALVEEISKIVEEIIQEVLKKRSQNV